MDRKHAIKFYGGERVLTICDLHMREHTFAKIMYRKNHQLHYY
jgi:hypothetical protein